MENINVNEVITNEETMDVIVETMPEVTSGNGLKIVGAAGLALGLGFVGYKFVVKPVVAKIKAKKKAKAEDEAEVE